MMMSVELAALKLEVPWQVHAEDRPHYHLPL